ncbi:MAG: hypothetical protein J1G04_07430, partial [Clostridiales bacterium]|nr:hypothetical protein [Clostridiales bacterium]
DSESIATYYTRFEGSQDTTYTYYAYNTKNGARILSDFRTNNTYSVATAEAKTENNVHLFDVLMTTEIEGKGEDATTYFSIYAEDGTQLVKRIKRDNSVVQKISYSLFSNCKIKTSSIPDARFNIVNVKLQNGTQEAEDYYVIGESANNAIALEKVEKDNIVFIDPLLDVGSDIFAAVQPFNRFVAALNGSSSVNEVEGDLAAYSIGSSGNDMVFYKDGEETGRVNMDNVSDGAVGFAGNYMYYVKATAVSQSDKDANLIITDVGAEMRFINELHRYDILKGKDKKLSYNVAISSIQSAYNKQTKSYDALVLNGINVVNKVAQMNRDFTYIVDSELKINYDASGVKRFRLEDLSSTDFGKFVLEEQKYYDSDGDNNFGDYTVLNEDLSVVARFEKSHLYAKSQLFSFEQDGKTGFARPDGTIAVAPLYTNFLDDEKPFTLFDGFAVAQNAVTDKKVIFNTKGTERDFPTNGNGTTITTGTDDEYLKLGWYLETYTDSENNKKSYTINNFAGGGADVDSWNPTNLVKIRNNMLEFSSTSTGDTPKTYYNMYVVDSGRWSYTVSL